MDALGSGTSGALGRNLSRGRDHGNGALGQPRSTAHRARWGSVGWDHAVSGAFAACSACPQLLPRTL
jgi:hypothetical protein